ncbi:MAG TPA: ATP-binding protein, partial [Thermomicrobiales bacterium]|nr:ATP-binding protein [Thermomicrobiales bacterium]
MARAPGTARELRQVALELTGSLDLAVVVARALAAVRALVGADWAAIALVDEATGGLERFADPPEPGGPRRHEAAGASRAVLARRAARFIPDLVADPATEPDLFARGLRAAAILPLAAQDTTVGLLYACCRPPHTFTRRECAILRALAAPTAVALRNARRYAEATGATADLRALLAGLEQGVLMTDRAGRIRFVNGRFADLFGGLDAADLLGRPQREVAARLLAPRLRDPGAYLARLAWLDAHPEESATDTLELLRPPGRILERFGGPLRDEVTGALLGRVVAFTDVTEARRLQRGKEEFLSVASHELKTPITTLGGYLEMIQRQVAREAGPDPARLTRYIANAQTQLARLHRLSEDLLEVARIETGRLSVRPEPGDLAMIVQETVARFVRHPRPEQAERGGPLIYQAAEPLPGYFDALRLEQVFANLLENAVKYSSAGGEITVVARREGDTGLVSVRDQGIGIPAEERARLFTPFFRATNAQAGAARGLGLGLYICRGIVEAHG